MLSFFLFLFSLIKKQQLLKTNDKILKQKFEAVFREYFVPLCYFAKKYLGDLDSSKEIVHSVFIRIWENRHEFDWEKPCKSYLFTSVYNRSMNHLRDHKKFSSEDVTVLQIESENHVFTDQMEIAELEARIKTSLQGLPGKCREVFEMNRFEGKKYQEIANDLNISVKTVETHISKAIRILKEDLKDYITILVLLIIKNMDSL